jgi:hypothetical protein
MKRHLIALFVLSYGFCPQILAESSDLAQEVAALRAQTQTLQKQLQTLQTQLNKAEKHQAKVKPAVVTKKIKPKSTAVGRSPDSPLYT